MPRAFAEIAFTPTVRAEQARHGSAKAYESFLAPGDVEGDRLGPEEAAFIAARDGFYQATVSETGWPYVQFRGGPRGFVRVLDETRIAYADFRGNRQYLSHGNLETDDRIAMIFMDYPNRRRLKLLGHARFVEAADEPDLVAALMPEGYRARAEHAVVIEVAGLDWNCPSHIPERFTLEELGHALSPVRDEIAALRAENARLAALVGEAAG